MNKKLTLLVISLVVLSACSGQYTGKHFNTDMPLELKELYISTLEENLGVLEEEPDNKKALSNIAYQYDALGNYKMAIKYYKQVLEINPNEHSSLNNLANIYEELEDYDKAVEYIERLYMSDALNIEIVKDAVRIYLLVDDVQAVENILAFFKKNRPESELKDNVIIEIQGMIDKYYNQN